MKAELLSIQNFNADQKILYRPMSQEKRLEKTKAKNPLNFAFIKNQHLSKGKCINAPQRPKTSHQVYNQKNWKNKIEEQERIMKNLSVRLENKKSIFLEETIFNTANYIANNYFPQRKTKKLNNSQWYKYCVKIATPMDNFNYKEIHRIIKKSRGLLSSKQAKQSLQVSIGRSVYIPKSAKNIPYGKTTRIVKEKAAEISPWMINKDQQITGF